MFYEDINPRAPFTIAHYSNFIKVDLFIYTFSRLKPSLWLKGIKIEYDPSGKLQQVLNQYNEMSYTVSTEEVEVWRGKLFAYIHEVYRRVMREEYYYAARSSLDEWQLSFLSSWMSGRSQEEINSQPRAVSVSPL